MPSSLVVRNRHLMVRLQGCNLWRLHFRLKWYISPAHQAQPSEETVLFASAWSLLRLFRPQYASSRMPIIRVNSTILPIVGRSSLDWKNNQILVTHSFSSSNYSNMRRCYYPRRQCSVPWINSAFKPPDLTQHIFIAVTTRLPGSKSTWHVSHVMLSGPIHHNKDTN